MTRSHVSFWKGVKATKGEHWREALVLSGFTQLGGLAPLWIGWLIMSANQRNPSLLDFAQNGEFALYSASLLAPVFYLAVHERSSAPFASRAVFVLVALTGILVAVATYGMVAPEVSKLSVFPQLDRRYIGALTLWLFAISSVFSLIATALDNARTTPAVEAIVHEQQQRLEDDFDQLGDNDDR